MDKKYGLLFLAMLCPTLFTGCSSEKEESPESEEEEATGDIQLHILNVEDYIAEDTEDEESGETTYGVETLFEAYCKEVLGKDVNVVYETTDTPETMLMLLQTGRQYDLICPSDYMIQRMGNEGLIEPLDLSLISTEKSFEYKPEGAEEAVFEFETSDTDNYSNYSSRKVREYLDNCFTDQKCYEGKDADYISSHPLAVGYMWGTLGILFNPEYGDFEAEDTIKDMQTWDAFWNETYRNKSSVKDSMRDTFAVGVIHKYYEDFELNGAKNKGFKSLMNDYKEGNLTAEEYNAAIDRIFNMDESYVGNKKDMILNVLDDLHDLKKNIRGLEVDTGKNDIVNGYIGVNCAWSGDAVYSMELGEAADPAVELWYSVPEEGSNVWFDGWCMPKNENRSATQKAMAMEFLNFLSSPAVAALNMESTGYTSFIGGDSILEMVREWYDCRYDEEKEEFAEVDAAEIAANVESGDWQEVDLSYFFEDTLVDYDDADMKFYTNEDTGFYLPFKDDGNISCGGAFFCQYPDEAVINRCCVMKDFGEYNESITKMWEQFKSTTLEPWAFALLGIEVGAAISVGVYFFIKKRKKMALKAQRKNID